MMPRREKRYLTKEHREKEIPKPFNNKDAKQSVDDPAERLKLLMDRIRVLNGGAVKIDIINGAMASQTAEAIHIILTGMVEYIMTT